jgi:hypothetical protein
MNPQAPSLFIAFDGNDRREYQAAMRLSTIGTLYGVTVSMPDMSAIGEHNTKERMGSALVCVVFATSGHSEVADKYLRWLADIGKQAIVLYDAKYLPSIRAQPANLVEAWVPIDFESHSIDSTLTDVANRVHHIIAFQNELKKMKSKQLATQQNNEKAINVLLGIGVGLLVLAVVAEAAKK